MDELCRARAQRRRARLGGCKASGGSHPQGSQGQGTLQAASPAGSGSHKATKLWVTWVGPQHQLLVAAHLAGSREGVERVVTLRLISFPGYGDSKDA